MKRFTIISIFAILLTGIFAQKTKASSDYNMSSKEDCGCNGQSDNTSAQNTYSQDAIVFEESPFKDIDVPAPQERSIDNVLWKKTIWRIIDMREQANFPLYYPLTESNGRKNLFLTIFELLEEGKVTAYKYQEDKEDFSEENKLTFEQIMATTKIDVYETSTDEEGNTIYQINSVDIPNKEVLKYYIKEVWYYDGMESCMKTKIAAIAPQLYYTDDDGKSNKEVLFWIPFDQLRPYLAQQPVVINNKNSTAFISYDDLFQKRRYIGHIYKEDNIQNRAIIEYCKTPEEVHREQARIENEILNFEFDLWEY